MITSLDIAHRQTHFAGTLDTDIPGNCTQAAIASLLGLPLDAVPHFLLFKGVWDSALTAWLSTRGLTLRVWTTSDAWAEGWRQLGVEVAPLEAAPAEGLLLLSGPSPRGDFLHLVVGERSRTFDGWALVWDPHPDSDGLAGDPVEIWAIS